MERVGSESQNSAQRVVEPHKKKIFNYLSPGVPIFSGYDHVWKKYNKYIKGELYMDLKSR
jgi:hypothetical protein